LIEINDGGLNCPASATGYRPRKFYTFVVVADAPRSLELANQSDLITACGNTSADWRYSPR
jgi:hypothetical protein